MKSDVIELPAGRRSGGVRGISSQLLEWKGIEATEKLASSANSKVVVIGNPKSGLPIILGGGDK
jgi:regulator of protease activity HflC (stomatin/prohibitin superfamily)